ncbi:ferredoxin [Salpingoeca rosetta]|uniref:Ferredoxin n=1 Tax=Salpingoeca rosetta (strain ATCC 50818 / BSB-021) TaxID=946362 RepID=F2U7G8_SALR5|nr:ferredoxin [Salpingoeca rosetta]EGD83385.1 ferredoxin [Salpingoeca rosetta]|eukprot:XP_004994889.1 ferredoxin [Salpingoeca rosetta]
MAALVKKMVGDVPLHDTGRVADAVDALIEHCKMHCKDAGVEELADTATCKDVLAFVRQHRDLRAQEIPVHRSLLPKNCTSMAVVDIRVKSRGPDDLVFLHNKDIRDRIARGNSILQLQYKGKALQIPVLQGLRKFTGGLGDDDDMPAGPGQEAAWTSYFLAPIEQAHTIFSMEKANGEAAHLACRWIQNKYVLVCGSKNVHMCVTKRSDIELYTDSKFRIAAVIARVIFECLEKLEDKGAALLSFLACTGFTANFELLQPSYQHVELLGDTPRLLFFAFTAQHFDGQRSSLCDVHPLVGIEIMRRLGMETVNYDVIPFIRFNEHTADVRRTFGKEGRVLYILDSDTTTGNVIGLFKKKTIWYVVLRAIREKVKAAVSRVVKSPDTPYASIRSSCVTKTNARLRDIRDWLGFSKDELMQWQALAKRFIEWVISEEHLAFDATAHRDQYRPRARRERQQQQQQQQAHADNGDDDGDDGDGDNGDDDASVSAAPSFTPEAVGSLFPKVWAAFLQDQRVAYPSAATVT